MEKNGSILSLPVVVMVGLALIDPSYANAELKAASTPSSQASTSPSGPVRSSSPSSTSSSSANPGVAPPQITTQAGGVFKLYNNVEMAQPLIGGLAYRGFDRIFTWDNHNPKISWFNEGVPPSPPLVDGSSQQADVQTMAKGICALIDPVKPTLVVLDAEWVLYTGQPGTIDGPYAVNANLNSLVLMLKWMKAGLAQGSCASRVKLAAYGVPPMGWDLLYTGETAAQNSSVKSWQNLLTAIVTQIKPYVDFLAPSLYAPWAADKDPELGSHVTAWKTSVESTLPMLTGLGLPVIPYLGLRYYDNIGSTYRYKYVEAPFFQTMLDTVTAPKYGLAGAVYWDFAGYGGPGYANDGTDVWNANANWYQLTFSYFKAPPAISATSKKQVLSLINLLMENQETR